MLLIFKILEIVFIDKKLRNSKNVKKLQNIEKESTILKMFLQFESVVFIKKVIGW